jgi:hypothetical protein
MMMFGKYTVDYEGKKYIISPILLLDRNIRSWQADKPSFSGVYLFYENHYHQNKLLYIGGSDNILNRIYTHLCQGSTVNDYIEYNIGSRFRPCKHLNACCVDCGFCICTCCIPRHYFVIYRSPSGLPLWGILERMLIDKYHPPINKQYNQVVYE